MLLCGPAAAATAGVTTISNPGGGTIAYAQLPKQHTAQDAMSQVLQYVKSSFGARPDVGKYMKSPDGNSLAATFTVTRSGKQMAGLALVAASANGPSAGAVLSDTADRFRTSLQPMLTRLQQEAVAKGGSAGAQAAIANAGGSDAKPGAPAASASSTSASSSGTLSSAAPMPSAPPAKLIQTPIPDGTGSIGLPEGWRITAAHAGDVRAQGPNGESLRFGMAQSVLDPNNPQSRALMGGNFVSIPFGTPGDQAYTAMVSQLARKSRQAAPTIHYTTVKQFPDSQGGGKNWMLVANVGTPAGPVVSWTEVAMSTPLAAGGWMMTIYNIAVPPALADKEAATVASMFPAYKPNYAAITAAGNADFHQVMGAFRNTSDYIRNVTDATDRSTTATTNYLLGKTVISDSALNAHGTVSDDVANALINAYPDRFQSVSSGGYVQGIDY
jgi:hypothetical protein